eukprot:COSAG02_NODE_18671_length_925_cov_2.484262_1_plen_60_part_01
MYHSSHRRCGVDVRVGAGSAVMRDGLVIGHIDGHLCAAALPAPLDRRELASVAAGSTAID